MTLNNIFFFSFFSFLFVDSFAQKPDTIEQWKMVEIRLTSSKTYTNPFEEVEVTATFTGPDGKVVHRPAFWDGGNTWRVRFAPTATGLWKMTTSCNDKANTGLNNMPYSILCKPYTGKLDIYKHGFLKVSENKRYFEYEDGTPFFYLGDTHWLYIHERFASSNVKGIPSEFKYIVDKRVDQGFTVYQSEAIQHPHGQNSPIGGGSHSGKDEEPHCNFRDGFSEADLPGFANIDRKFKYIAGKGLVHANSSVCWALDPAEYPAIYTEHYMYELGRYWSARYGAYPVLWTIAQEIDRNMYGKYDSTTIKKWFALAAGIAESDDYHHPLTAHMENTDHTIASTSWWGSLPIHRWWAIQWQGDMTDMATAKDFWLHPDTKPGILYESPYEDFWTDANGARSTAYKAFQYGIYGYGYGANGVWNDLYSKDPADYGTDYEMPVRFTSWFDGVNLLGASQMRYFKKFYTSLKWWKLIPRFDDDKWSSFVDKKQALIATDGQQTFVVYFFNKVRATGDLKNLEKDTRYTAKWYNPKNGIYTDIGNITTETGTWAIPYKPDSDDWILLVTAQSRSAVEIKKAKDYEVAVYYFPNYHPDSINTRWHGKGWTEWEVVKAAKPRFPGHEQPKIPSWGYFNEADPAWAAKEIDLAADNGIDIFIYDWYWYASTGQYLQEGLEKGFLQAPNRNRLKFALMWANHDWLNIQPATYDNGRVKLTKGEVSPALWDTISTYIVEKYFKQPNYWKIDGKPYFSIYEIVTFINGLGGMEEAKKAIRLLDEKTKKAGFPGVHLNIMSWMINDDFAKTIVGPGAPTTAKEMLKELGNQSVSTYCYIHHYTNMNNDGFPTVPVEKAFASAKEYWKQFTAEYPGILYTPNVSMGWDASPRCMQSDKFELHGYPWTPVFAGNTPAAFEKQLQEAKSFLDAYNPKHKILVLNSWNEWTEGSYLLPEKKYGDAYLKAIHKVFPTSCRSDIVFPDR